jgi:hypothetical protein
MGRLESLTTILQAERVACGYLRDKSAALQRDGRRAAGVVLL